MRKLVEATLHFLASSRPWGNAYGLARTLLALGTALTIGGNDSDLLFRHGQGLPAHWIPICTGVRSASLFCALGAERLELARWICVSALLLVASGWRPRITGILHWYVSFSLQASAITLDGGDNLTAVLTFLLLPITLTDSRRSHWQAQPRVECNSLLAGFGFVMTLAIRMQVALVYLHAAIGKVQVEQWANGTALYYWFTDPMFGLPRWAAPLIVPLLRHGSILMAMTWSAITLELFLFAALVMPAQGRKLMLLLGLSFHLVIAALMGLVSFGFAMSGALILFLWPLQEELPIVEWSRKLWLRISSRATSLGGNTEPQVT